MRKSNTTIFEGQLLKQIKSIILFITLLPHACNLHSVPSL